VRFPRGEDRLPLGGAIDQPNVRTGNGKRTTDNGPLVVHRPVALSPTHQEVSMATDTPRVAPVPREQWDDEVREILAASQMGGRVLNIFQTLAHHPKLMKRWLVFGNHVLFKSTLSPRERELLILRTGWNCRAE
jgi:hypothetical protein